MPPSGSGPYGAWSGAAGSAACDELACGPTVGACDREHPRARWPQSVTRSYIRPHVPDQEPPCPGGRHGVASHESRDPIGYAVAALNRLASSELLDRVGLRKHAEQTVFTRDPRRLPDRRRPPAAPSPAPAQAARPAPAPPPPRRAGVFDLTPTEDEQMLVDVVTELAAEVVRPAAADADDACAAPDGGARGAASRSGCRSSASPSRSAASPRSASAMAGTLVAEALAQGRHGPRRRDPRARRRRHRDRRSGAPTSSSRPTCRRSPATTSRPPRWR